MNIFRVLGQTPQPELYDSGSDFEVSALNIKHGHQGCGKNLCGARCGFEKERTPTLKSNRDTTAELYNRMYLSDVVLKPVR